MMPKYTLKDAGASQKCKYDIGQKQVRFAVRDINWDNMFVMPCKVLDTKLTFLRS